MRSQTHQSLERSSRGNKQSLALGFGILWAASHASAQEPTIAENPEAEIEGSLPPQIVESTAPAPQPRPVPQPVPVAEVETEAEPLVLDDALFEPRQLTSTKYTQPILDIPQTVQVIPETLIRDQGATSLREALRNVSGISLQAGEGSAGPGGDNLTLRGFGARNDFYVDGIRDFGSYTRDPFNLEQIEVVKGPASANSGRGSTGGYINLASKQAQLDDFLRVDTSVGSDNLFRGTLDFNKASDEIEGAAFRANVLYHDQDIPGRDHVFSSREAVDATLGFGLHDTSDTRLFLNVFYQEEDNLSDYGIPFVPTTVTDPAFIPFIGGPAPVDFDTYYGLVNRDFENLDTARFTARLEHDLNDSITLRNQTRVGQSNRFSVASTPRFNAANPAQILLNFADRDETINQFVNQTDFLFEFETGSLKHEALFGFEIAAEDYHRQRYTPTIGNAATATDPFDPNQISPDPSFTPNANFSDAEMLSTGLYLFDTVEVTPWLDITGGARFDRVDLDFVSNLIPSGGRTDDIASGRAAAIFKPAENGTVYFGWGTSYDLSIDRVLLDSGIANTSPVESETFELGTKWNVLDERLTLSAALFRIDKTNAVAADQLAGSVALSGDQRVDGFELGAAGQVTPWLNLFFGYTHLNSELLASALPANAASVGKALPMTPEDSVSLWMQADLSDRLFVGGGPVYVDSRFNSRPSIEFVAPSYLVWDALVGYHINENLTLRVNVNNISDEDYAGTVASGHFIPGEARSVMFSASMEF